MVYWFYPASKTYQSCSLENEKNSNDVLDLMQLKKPTNQLEDRIYLFPIFIVILYDNKTHHFILSLRNASISCRE